MKDLGIYLGQNILHFIKLKFIKLEVDTVGRTIKSRGGGGGSESTDRQGCAILALKVVPKNLIFT